MDDGPRLMNAQYIDNGTDSSFSSARLGSGIVSFLAHALFEKSRWHDRWALILLSDEAPRRDVESGGRLHTL